MHFNLLQLCEPSPTGMRTLVVHNIGGADVELFFQQ